MPTSIETRFAVPTHDRITVTTGSRASGPSAAGIAPVVLCDLDGVVWLADRPLPGVDDAVIALRSRGLRVAFATNNSSLTVGQYLDKLAGMGVTATASELVTSAMAAAQLLSGDLRPDATVLTCSGEGVVEAMRGCGFRVVDQGPCDAVVVGWHQTFNFERLARASSAVRAGARFVATNADPTYPAPGGLLPGNGALVAAVATAAGVDAEVAGKPYQPMVTLVRERFGATGVMVGDRPSTDGALARALGWPFVLVTSDASATEAIEPSPDLITPNLRDAVDAIAVLARR